MFSILLACLIIVAIVMVLVILLQRSEGSGISGSQAASMFGGALTGASAGNFLTKLTAWLATIFFVICIALAVVVSKQGNNIGKDSDVRSALKDSAKTVPAKPADSNDDVSAKDAGVSTPTVPELPAPETPVVPEN